MSGSLAYGVFFGLDGVESLCFLVFLDAECVAAGLKGFLLYKKVVVQLFDNIVQLLFHGFVVDIEA